MSSVDGVKNVSGAGRAKRFSNTAKVMPELTEARKLVDRAR